MGQFIALCIITMSAHEYTLSRALPRHVSAEHAISLLHCYENIISLSPHVIKHDALTSPADTTQLYNIVDKIDHLPFGLYSGKVPIKAEFTNNTNGVTSIRDAPSRLTLQEVWSVQPHDDITETGDAGNELVLEVKMSGSSAILTLLKNVIKKSHERISM